MNMLLIWEKSKFPNLSQKSSYIFNQQTYKPKFKKLDGNCFFFQGNKIKPC